MIKREIHRARIFTFHSLFLSSVQPTTHLSPSAVTGFGVAVQFSSTTAIVLGKWDSKAQEKHSQIDQ